MERLRQQAKTNIETGEVTVRRWWVDKYKRPSNDALYMSRCWAEWQIEMYEDLYVRREELQERMKDGNSDKASTLKILNSINAYLDETVEVEDDLVDQWEKELAEGKMPDLNAKV